VPAAAATGRRGRSSSQGSKTMAARSRALVAGEQGDARAHLSFRASTSEKKSLNLLRLDRSAGVDGPRRPGPARSATTQDGRALAARRPHVAEGRRGPPAEVARQQHAPGQLPAAAVVDQARQRGAQLPGLKCLLAAPARRCCHWMERVSRSSGVRRVGAIRRRAAVGLGLPAAARALAVGAVFLAGPLALVVGVVAHARWRDCCWRGGAGWSPLAPAVVLAVVDVLVEGLRLVRCPRSAGRSPRPFNAAVGVDEQRVRRGLEPSSTSSGLTRSRTPGPTCA